MAASSLASLEPARPVLGVLGVLGLGVGCWVLGVLGVLGVRFALDWLVFAGILHILHRKGVHVEEPASKSDRQNNRFWIA